MVVVLIEEFFINALKSKNSYEINNQFTLDIDTIRYSLYYSIYFDEPIDELIQVKDLFRSLTRKLSSTTLLTVLKIASAYR
mgnify:CR=1 FL=1